MSSSHKSFTSLREYFSAYRETKEVLLWMWKELTTRQSRRWVGVFVFLTSISLLVFTLQPLVFGWLINSVTDKDTRLILIMVLMLCSLALLRQGISYMNGLAREWLLNRNALQIHDRLNELFYEKTLGQHADEGSDLNYGSIEKAKNRIGNIQEMIFFETTETMLMIFFSLVFLWFMIWEAALVVTFLMVVHIFWSLYLNYHVSVSMDPIEQEFRHENKELIERWEKIVRVKTSGKAISEQKRLSGWFGETLQKDRKFWFWFNGQATVREVFGQIVRLLAVGYGVYMVYVEERDVGFLVPLYTWVTHVVQSLWYIGHAERRINEQIPYIKAMKEVLSATPSFLETKGVKFESAVPIGISFKYVSLSYGEKISDQCVGTLRDISFSIKPGEKVALIGPSGAGKSSIMRLMLRFMDPSEGEIWVNGHELKDLDLTSWMNSIGYIPQDGQVFDGTIRYNLTFGLSEERQKTITDEEIWDVMKLLQIDFGDRLTSGLETVVGRDGMKLSGGERQRLMAGAAVIKQPIFMIIDEATSSLDSTTEKAVQKGFEKVLSGPAGALIVAHRLSTVRTMCDRFIVLRKLSDTPENESQIEATASSFEELYKISPTFRTLADDQDIVI